MRTAIVLTVAVVWPLHSGLGQGAFFCSAGFSNTFDTRTRVGSIDGPLAGEGYVGQCLAGETIDTTIPVLSAHGFSIPGTYLGGTAILPGSPPGTTVYVQFAAWDGRLWGTTFSAVPQEWIGRSDIATARLVDPGLPGAITPAVFQQAAIIPVPEPSFWVLAALGGSVLFVHFRRGRLVSSRSHEFNGDG